MITAMNKAAEKWENSLMARDSQSAIFAVAICRVRLESQLKMELTVQGVHPERSKHQMKWQTLLPTCFRLLNLFISQQEKPNNS